MKLRAIFSAALIAAAGAVSAYDLREDTASQEFPIALKDVTDGTPMTGETFATTSIDIFKSGSSTGAAKNSGACSEDGTTGTYICTFDATDTDTPGSMKIVVTHAGAYASEYNVNILPAEVYDAKYVSGALDLRLGYEGGGTTPSQAGITDIDASGGTSDELILASGAVTDDDNWIGVTITLSDGSGNKQSCIVDAADAATDTISCPGNWKTAPTSGGGDTYTVRWTFGERVVALANDAVKLNVDSAGSMLVSQGQSTGQIDLQGGKVRLDDDQINSSTIDATGAAEIADAILDEVCSGHVTSGTLGAACEALIGHLPTYRVFTVDTGNTAPSESGGRVTCAGDLTLPGTGAADVTTRTDDELNNEIAVLASSSAPPPDAPKTTYIFDSAWDDTNKEAILTFDTDFGTALCANGDVFHIRGL